LNAAILARDQALIEVAVERGAAGYAIEET
jgi:hypothetical protein